MTKLVGYAEHGPHDGIGPFRTMFNGGIRLLYEKDLSNVDAVLLWGGSDISPSLYDEPAFAHSGPSTPTERDLFEWELCRQAVERNIPIIGICRGAQLLCAFAGGKLIQNVQGHHGDHGITCHTGEVFNVSSSHHQMLYPYDVPHEMLAWSSKKRSMVYQGVSKEIFKNMNTPSFEEPEVVYFPEINGFGIQCHPEWHHNVHSDAGGVAFNKWVFEEINERCFNKVC